MVGVAEIFASNNSEHGSTPIIPPFLLGCRSYPALFMYQGQDATVTGRGEHFAVSIDHPTVRLTVPKSVRTEAVNCQQYHFQKDHYDHRLVGLFICPVSTTIAYGSIASREQIRWADWKQP